MSNKHKEEANRLLDAVDKGFELIEKKANSGTLSAVEGNASIAMLQVTAIAAQAQATLVMAEQLDRIALVLENRP